jgi:hypothetical protein
LSLPISTTCYRQTITEESHCMKRCKENNVAKLFKSS